MPKKNDTDAVLIRCPRCWAAGYAHPGEPPSEPSDPSYYNRCQGHALTGQPGGAHISALDSDSWFFPSRGSKICGQPFTDKDGTLFEPPRSFREFIEITKHPFDPEELAPKEREPVAS